MLDFLNHLPRTHIVRILASIYIFASVLVFFGQGVSALGNIRLALDWFDFPYVSQWIEKRELLSTNNVLALALLNSGVCLAWWVANISVMSWCSRNSGNPLPQPIFAYIFFCAVMFELKDLTPIKFLISVSTLSLSTSLLSVYIKISTNGAEMYLNSADGLHELMMPFLRKFSETFILCIMAIPLSALYFIIMPVLHFCRPDHHLSR